MTVIVEVSVGYEYATVDLSDLEVVVQYRWSLQKSTRTYYATTTIEDRTFA